MRRVQMEIPFESSDVCWVRGNRKRYPGPASPSTRYGIIEDAISEMDSWYCFNRQELATSRPSLLSGTAISAAASTKNAAPIHREKIGRNQPCPCGSGKKYKKCCGSN